MKMAAGQKAGREGKHPLPARLALSICDTAPTARVTLPLRRQRVQAYTCLGLPSTMALTRFTFGFQVRLERLWEWLTLMPKAISLPQNSHFATCEAPPFLSISLYSMNSLSIIAERRDKCKLYFHPRGLFMPGGEKSLPKRASLGKINV